MTWPEVIKNLEKEHAYVDKQLITKLYKFTKPESDRVAIDTALKRHSKGNTIYEITPGKS